MRITNVAQTPSSVGFDGFGIEPALIAALVLAVGIAITSTVVFSFRDAAYGLVIVWACVGVAVKESDTVLVAGMTIPGALIMGALVAAAIVRNRAARGACGSTRRRLIESPRVGPADEGLPSGHAQGTMAYAPRVTRARTAALTRPYLGPLRFLALSSLGVLVAHDAVFIAQYGIGAGYDAAMAQTAHGYWPAFILLTLLVSAASAVTALRAITHLSRLGRGLPPDAPAPGRPAYWSEVRHLWPRLFALVAAGFLIQENVEHLISGNGLPGLWVLSAPDYPLAIPTILVVTGLLAAAGAWIQWRREVLIERLRAAHADVRRQRNHAARAPHDRWALLAALLVHRWTLLRRDAERAPPLSGAA